jgi:aryl-alcohol dehydrogenase-like predicted oxidoreductase
MGTGTIGFGGGSNQTRLGTSPFTNLLLNGFHENGLRFFDSADSYGSHPYVAAALKQLPRDKVTVLTKTDTRDPAGVRADLDRFRRELGVDHIDIVLIHCVTEGDWTTPSRRASFGLLASPATALRLYALPPLLRGSRSISSVSTRSALIWMPTRM